MSHAVDQNPLLTPHTLPPFNDIRPEHVVPAIEKLLADDRHIVEEVVAKGDYSWKGLVQPLDTYGEATGQAWSPVSHLNSVMNSTELRAAYQSCLGELSAYSTWFGQHQGLFKAYQALRDGQEYAQLSIAQKRAIDNTLRDFRLAGVDLPEDKKKRFGEIRARLSELSNQFSNNVLDATQAWHLDVERDRLSGLPESALDMLKANAEAKGVEGYRITLDFPSYFPVMSYADDRALREEVYTAFVTRASDQGPNAGQYDNSVIMSEMVTLRQELAALLGFATYAELSLATKMAASPAQVLDFLNDLADRARPQAETEFGELQQFAQEQLGLDTLAPWDITYASEKLREQRYAISQEALRPYFPAPKVIEGLFGVVNRLYGLTFRENKDVEVWHPDVRYFEVLEDDQPIAGFYLDLYAREGKRGGAWMDACRTRRRREDGSLQLPVAYLVCNFTRPVGDRPALLTHDEVTTLFHEFGHGLHHMLTQQEVSDVSGISGVAWDAVELPSQFMENFCWEREGLDLIASHVDTGETLPQALFDKLVAARNFQSAMMMMRQLEFSLFDFRLHNELKTPSADDIQSLLNDVRLKVAVVPQTRFNRFQHGFSHIFAGGYAAGYYSYKWAEVLSSDAYSAFEEAGVFDRATGQRFRQEILEKGGAEDAAVLFQNFRGRAPRIDALLRHSGITASV
ncbi:oligopeptidase A [Zymobacter palmae]|uniref:oligopeptidase A n=1 Tax=Zymobacter palmae TaxID=33074 RepID=A0A348HIC1_9GAMM|nr:oligopeptidase A [Zymobacter palmae]BBG31373.1 Zn-dependent oligopeptidases [Zymobacter palmae]